MLYRVNVALVHMVPAEIAVTCQMWAYCNRTKYCNVPKFASRPVTCFVPCNSSLDWVNTKALYAYQRLKWHPIWYSVPLAHRGQIKQLALQHLDRAWLDKWCSRHCPPHDPPFAVLVTFESYTGPFKKETVPILSLYSAQGGSFYTKTPSAIGPSSP